MKAAVEPRFFVLAWRTLHGQFAVEVERMQPRRGDAALCPVCGKPVSMKQWLAPRRVRLKIHGDQMPDATSMPNGLLATARFREAFTAAELTGISFVDVEVVRASQPKVLARASPVYFGAVSRGRASLDVAGSNFERGPSQCSECRRMLQVERLDRLVIEPESWDGLDAFFPRGLPGTVVVSERFSKMCVQRGLVGVPVVPASEYRFDAMPWTKSKGVGET